MPNQRCLPWVHCLAMVGRRVVGTAGRIRAVISFVLAHCLRPLAQGMAWVAN